jgi:uncharacterized OB-fold protein
MNAFGPESTSALARPFWEGAARDRLLMPFDGETGRPLWYPREADLARMVWRELGGGATLVAWSVVRGPLNPLFEPPYAPALVEPDEAPGVRLVTRLVECDFGELRCDQRLELCFRTLSPRGRAEFRAPVFRPAK